MSQLPVTVVVPVKNDAANLRACLPSLGRFHQVVVVDSGSTDGTREVALEHGAVLLDFRWNGRFPKKRNWALRNHAFETDWVLFLDADESATPRFCDELARKLADGTVHGYVLFYDNWFMGRRLLHGDRMRKLALVRRGRGEYEHVDEQAWSSLDMEVHEHIVVDGPVGRIEAPLVHRNFQSLDHYYRRHLEYAAWEVSRYLALRGSGQSPRLRLRQRLKYALIHSPVFPPLYFLTTYVFMGGFLDGFEGFAFGISKMAYFYQILFRLRDAEKRA